MPNASQARSPAGWQGAPRSPAARHAVGSQTAGWALSSEAPVCTVEHFAAEQWTRCKRQTGKRKVPAYVWEDTRMWTRQDCATLEPDSTPSTSPFFSLAYVFIAKKCCKMKFGSSRLKTKWKERDMLPQTLIESGDFIFIFTVTVSQRSHPRSVTLLLLLLRYVTITLVSSRQLLIKDYPQHSPLFFHI